MGELYEDALAKETTKRQRIAADRNFHRQLVAVPSKGLPFFEKVSQNDTPGPQDDPHEFDKELVITVDGPDGPCTSSLGYAFEYVWCVGER